MSSNLDFDDESFLKSSIIKMKMNELRSSESDLSQEVIILDDDDFIQTTLNFLHTKSNEEEILCINGADVNSTQLAQTCHTSHETNLIDLTGDFDVDLSNLFLINPTVEHSHFISSNQFQTINNKIKDEFDFKMFNFNSIDEILIDDENGENCRMIDLSTEISQVLGDTEINNLTQVEANDQASPSNKEKTNFNCKYCQKSFNKLYNLNRHLFMHESKSGLVNSGSQFKVNKCIKCGREILDKSNFIKHLKICVGDDESSLIKLQSKSRSDKNKKETNCKKIFSCEICGRLFNKKFNYERHWRIHFLNLMEEEEEGKVAFFKCEKCARKFNEKKQLEAHRKKWHAMSLECGYCAKNGSLDGAVRFDEKLDYLRHLYSQHSVKFKFECKICLKQFKFVSQFVQHRQQHARDGLCRLHNSVRQEVEEDEDKLKKCEICSKTFTKTFNLKRHKAAKHSK